MGFSDAMSFPCSNQTMGFWVRVLTPLEKSGPLSVRFFPPASGAAPSSVGCAPGSPLGGRENAFF